MRERMQQQRLTLTLSIPEINLVLDALGQLPYAQVYELIGTIQQQAQAQIGLSPVEAPGEPA
ncbi:hypothetical protein [Sphaerisporangium album]|uniref:hypothetical protein n=1 Tax=Sphaerisporangium album TaxID=509200 RepID=UPI0011C0557C|nr:hypothetical protein [Sphaerisporangium album]